MLPTTTRRLLTTCAVALVAAATTASPAHASTYEVIPAPTTLVDTATPGGTVVSGPRALQAGILLPDGYAAHPKRRYPVLWLLHGASFDHNTWVKQQHIKELAAGLDAIIVMPDGGRFGMYTDWFNKGAFGTPMWTTYLLKELRAQIHKRYRIRTGRRWHAVAGISMGGQGTMRYASLLPGYFGSAASFSGALPDLQAPEVYLGLSVIIAGAGGQGVSYEDIFGPRDGFYARGMSPQSLVANASHSRVYLSSGNGANCNEDPVNPASIPIDIAVEFAIRNQQGPYAKALRAAGASVTTRETCGVHTFGVWSRAFKDAKDNWGFFKPVAENPTTWRYTSSARNGEAWGLRYAFTAPPTDLLVLKRDGATLTGTGTGTLRITGGWRCQFTVTLPFTHALSKRCATQ